MKNLNHEGTKSTKKDLVTRNTFVSFVSSW